MIIAFTLFIVIILLFDRQVWYSWQRRLVASWEDQSWEARKSSETAISYQYFETDKACHVQGESSACQTCLCF